LNDDKFLPENLARYIRGLSSDAYRVMEAYNLDDKIARLDRAGLLYAVVADFADLDVRPSMVSNEAMGYIFEELLRKFSEMSNETAGEHYTPREVIQLMVDLLLTGKASEELTQNPIPVRTLYDPAAGTGGSQHNHALDISPDHYSRPADSDPNYTLCVRAHKGLSSARALRAAWAVN
jgi:type I restriction enzyme M protein